MAYLNANIPIQYAQIKKEYLYDLNKHMGEVEDCIIFGITSLTGRAILFHPNFFRAHNLLCSVL